MSVRGAEPCYACSGRGTVEAGIGAHGGRFFNAGDRTPCSECDGVGELPPYSPARDFARRYAWVQEHTASASPRRAHA